MFLRADRMGVLRLSPAARNGWVVLVRQGADPVGFFDFMSNVVEQKRRVPGAVFL